MEDGDKHHPKRIAEDEKERNSCSGQFSTKNEGRITPISGNVADRCTFERRSGLIPGNLRTFGSKESNRNGSDMEHVISGEIFPLYATTNDVKMEARIEILDGLINRMTVDDVRIHEKTHVMEGETGTEINIGNNAVTKIPRLLRIFWRGIMYVSDRNGKYLNMS